tara:strand:- start:5540 stop:6721 length:1182 start_codon:yes stop_codon:yes gene_type:complete
MSSILKVDTIQDQNGNLIISKDSGGAGFEGTYYSSSSPKVFTVKVITKTASSPYYNVGSTLGYEINGVETPIIDLKGHDTSKPYYYKFDQSDASNATHPLRFYNNVGKTTAYTTGVTTSGTPGNAGAHTTIAIDNTTPNILYYQCSSHANMGNFINHNSTKLNTGAFLAMPAADGTNGQALTTNGSGTLSFTTVEETKPTVADVSQTIAPATGVSFNITGTNFSGIPRVEFIKTDGSITNANTVSLSSATSLAVNATLALGSYYVRVELDSGLAGRSTNAIITASTAPSWTTNAGSIGSIAGDFSGTVATVAATSDSTITYSETTNVLTNASQANCTLNSSTGVITTSDFGGSSTTPTTYTFTLRATDAEAQTVDRVFTLTSTFGATGGATFN